MRWLLWCFCLLAESYETINHYHYKLVKFCQFLLTFTMSRHQQVNKEVILTITSGDFHPKLTLTITWGDYHPNSQSNITSNNFLLGATWPPLLFEWKSPRVSIPGVWEIFAENLKVINADKCSPSLYVGTWTSFCSVLMVDRFHSVVWSQSSCP